MLVELAASKTLAVSNLHQHAEYIAYRYRDRRRSVISDFLLHYTALSVIGARSALTSATNKMSGVQCCSATDGVGPACHDVVKRPLPTIDD